jgi:Spy/CpxP family protein refolding chaperone
MKRNLWITTLAVGLLVLAGAAAAGGPQDDPAAPRDAAGLSGPRWGGGACGAPAHACQAGAQICGHAMGAKGACCPEMGAKAACGHGHKMPGCGGHAMGAKGACCPEMGAKAGCGHGQKMPGGCGHAMGPQQGCGHATGPQMMGPHAMGPQQGRGHAMGPQAMGPGLRPGGPGAAPGVGLGHGAMARLDLSDAQREQLAELHERTLKQNIQARADLRIAQMDLRKLMRAETPDARAIDSQIDKLAGLRAAIQKTRVGALLEARSLLTPEQRKQLQELRGPGGGRGPGPWGGMDDEMGPGGWGGLGGDEGDEGDGDE